MSVSMISIATCQPSEQSLSFFFESFNRRSFFRCARFRADREINHCMFTKDNKFLLMAIKGVKGLFQACLYQPHHVGEQQQHKTSEDLLFAEITKKPDLFGEAAELSVQGAY